MAIGTPALIDTFSIFTTGSTYTFTVPAGGVPAGAQIMALLSCSTEGITFSSGTDSASNSYSEETSVLSHPLDNLTYYLIKAPDVTALAEGNTISLTMSSGVTRRYGMCWYTTGLLDTGVPNEKSTVSTESTANPTSPSITTTVDDTIMFGCITFHSSVDRTLTEDSAFTTIGNANFDTWKLSAGYRIVSATETRNYDPSLNGSAQCHTQIVAYESGAVAPPADFPPGLYRKAQKRSTLLRM